MTAPTFMMKPPMGVHGMPAEQWAFTQRRLLFLAKFDERGSGDPGADAVFPNNTEKVTPRDSVSGTHPIVWNNDANASAPDPQFDDCEIGHCYRFSTTNSGASFGAGCWWDEVTLPTTGVTEYTLALTFQNMNGSNTLQRIIAIGSTYLSIQPVAKAIFMNHGGLNFGWWDFDDLDSKMNSMVVTFDDDSGMKLFINGQEANQIQDAAGTAGAIAWTNIAVGHAGIFVTQSSQFNGRVGLLLLSDKKWSDADAMNWSKEPYGFLYPADDATFTAPPVPDIIGCVDLDSSIEPTVQLDSVIDPAVDLATKIDPTVDLASEGCC
jgi:hypothetical protein